jgi:predicted dehydrogenase
MYRFHPRTQRVKQMVEDGAVGTIQLVASACGFVIGNENDIRLSKSLAGGSLMDVGCYCVSGARLIAGGEPDLVFGRQVMTADGVDRRFAGLLRFPSGLQATFHCGFDSFSETLEVIGREGTITLPDPWHSTRGILIVDGQEERVEPINPYQCELDDMAAAIRGQRAPRLGRADAMGQARAIEALYRSAASGEAVSLA